MVDTIGPMVRNTDGKAPSIRLLHVAGGALGGALTGFILGALGSLVPASAPMLWVLVPAAVIALVWDVARDGKKLGTARQTPRAWRYLLPPGVVAFLNGFDLGLGWSTRIYFVSYVVAMLAAFVAGHALVGALIGACFGGTRAAAVIWLEHRRLGGADLAPARGWANAVNAFALAQFVVLTVAADLLI